MEEDKPFDGEIFGVEFGSSIWEVLKKRNKWHRYEIAFNNWTGEIRTYKDGKLISASNINEDNKPQPLNLEELTGFTIREIKRRIKSACEFYRKYRNRPDKLALDFPQYKTKLHEFGMFPKQGSIGFINPNFEGYNNWLFELAFKDALKEDGENGKE